MIAFDGEHSCGFAGCRNATDALVPAGPTGRLPSRERDRRLVQADAIQSSKERLKISIVLAALQQAHRSKATIVGRSDTSLLVAQSGGPRPERSRRLPVARRPRRESRPREKTGAPADSPEPVCANPDASWPNALGGRLAFLAWHRSLLALRGRAGETPLLGHSPVASAVRQASTCARCEPGSCPSNAAGSGANAYSTPAISRTMSSSVRPVSLSSSQSHSNAARAA